MKQLRIGIGGIRFEANSFSPGVTPAAAFDDYYVRVGADVLLAEPNTEVYGALLQARASGVELVGLLDTLGGMGAPVDHTAYAMLKERFLERLGGVVSTLDAVVLPLHGAMTTTAEDDVEGDFAAAVRKITGPGMPIVASHDLHGAPTPRLVSNIDALVGFKTCPHVDYEDAGAKSVRIAAAAARGEVRPITLLHEIPMITPAEGHDTIDGPMAEIMRAVQRDAAAEGLLDESVFMVQPWLDAPRACWKLTAVVAADASVSSARDLLARHAQEIWERRAEFRVTKVPVADAVDAVAAHPGGVPLLLADGGDSPSAGSAGDSTDLLAALIASSDPRPRLAIVADAAAAKEAIVAGVGTEVTLSAGASSSDFTPPATLTGRVALVDDGFYTAIYPAGPVSVGPTVVVDVGPTTVVITSKPANMLDQEIYRHLGIDPAGFHAVQVKSAGGFRALWSDVSTVIVYVDSRGASDSTLKRLPYTRIRPGLWPFTPPSSPSK